MNRFGKLALIAGIVIAEGSVALAQSGATSGANPADRLICRRMPETGSIVRTRRQCFTRAEWDRIAESQQRGAGKMVQELSGGFNGNQ